MQLPGQTSSGHRMAGPHHMDEPHKWGSSRYIVLFAVSTLHVALVIALIIFARGRILLSFAPNPIELLVLPLSPAPQIRLPPPAPTDRPKKATPSAVPPAAAITIYPLAAPADEVGPPVDWAQEALSKGNNTQPRTGNGLCSSQRTAIKCPSPSPPLRTPLTRASACRRIAPGILRSRAAICSTNFLRTRNFTPTTRVDPRHANSKCR
jgi:hypothetical protein